MFTEQHVALALQKERLLGRIDVQRQDIVTGVAIFKKPFAAADKLVSSVQYVKERQWIVGAAALSVMVVGRKRSASGAAISGSGSSDMLRCSCKRLYPFCDPSNRLTPFHVTVGKGGILSH